MFKGVVCVQAGVLFVLVIGLLSWCVSELLGAFHIPILIIAIFLGLSFSFFYKRHRSRLEDGVNFSAKKLLRMGIVLYGFNVSFAEIALVGFEGVLLAFMIVVIVLVLGMWMGVKLLKIDKDLAFLVSGGSAICGAAAVLALESVIKSEPYKGLIAVGSVVVFGLLGMLAYPLLYVVLDGYLNEQQMGVYMGAVLHEVANVVGAGSAVGDEAQRLAVIVKMIRVIMLVPLLLFVSFLLSKQSSDGHLSIPWFAFMFLVAIGIHSMGWLPDQVVDILKFVCLSCLCMAMVALGLQIDFKKFIQVGGKAFVLALILFFVLMLLGFVGTILLF